MAGAGVALRRSRVVIGAWVAVVALCGLLGVVSGKPFAPTAIVAPGSESDRWFDLTDQADFGANLNVLLTGPRPALRRQGEELAARLRATGEARVVSPFDRAPGGRQATSRGERSLRLLRPNSALFVVDVRFERDQETAAALDPVREAVAATVRPPVESRVTGVPAIAEGLEDESYSATQTAELIATPLLIVVLLLIFRSPVAAAIPGILGLGTMIAANGLVHAVATQVSVDQIAVTVASMMALALGVDYSLLLVSRYREHRRDDPAAVDANIEAAGRAAGRTIAFAAVLLIAVMAGAAVLAVGPILASATLGVGLATAFGALSAIFVAPALLKELDPWLERWSIGSRRARSTPRWARPQPIAIPLIAIGALLLLAAPSLGLETGSPDVKLLPEGSPARVDYEQVGEAIGPGYGAAFNVLVQSRDGRPLTMDRSLAAITRVQRDLAADPGIVAVLGPAELNRVTRAAPRLERGLTAQSSGLARLDRGLTRAAAGSRTVGDGAGALHAATGEAHRGSAELAKGAHSAERGSASLIGGLDRASAGSDRLAQGSNRASAGAGKLSESIDEARSGSRSISSNAELLRDGLQAGSDQLGALGTPLDSAERSLASVWRALQAMTTGRTDPQFQAALEAARAASEALTGADPASGDLLDPAYGGVAAAIADADGQFDLGLYLAGRLRRQGDQTRRGVTKLSDGARQLDAGVARVAAANAELSEGLDRLAGSGARLPAGLVELSRGADALAEGVGKLEGGAGQLVAGIGGSATPGQLTGGLERMQRGVAEQRSSAQGGGLQENSPGLFDSGLLPLALIDGAPRATRERTQFVLDLSNSGRTAQITAFPAFETNDPRIDDLRERVGEIAHQIDRPGLEVAVGGPGAALEDYEDAASARLPAMIAAFVAISLLILIVAVRAIPLATLCVVLNILTIGVAVGVMQLAFGTSNPLLGGPGYVDILSLGVALAVIFALSIDYQTFLLARIREEYVTTGSNDRALTAAIGSTARVITGAATVMVAIFLAFSVSSYIAIREIGVGLAIAVFLDATVVRLVLLPAAMRVAGDRIWWFPGWLDRRLPNVSL
jgi:putative drug exporter of the RND superfamily